MSAEPAGSVGEAQSSEAVERGRDLLGTRPGDVSGVISIPGQTVDALRVEHVIDLDQSIGERGLSVEDLGHVLERLGDACRLLGINELGHGRQVDEGLPELNLPESLRLR